MIVLYDYEGTCNDERARRVHTSVVELTDKVVAKILAVKLELSPETAEAMVEKGSRDEEENWWSEDERYSVEIEED